MTAIITNNQPVIICTSCGKGFLVRPREGVDLDPVWRVNKGPEAGVCGGEIKVVERSFALRVAGQYEQVGGDNWLKGKRS